MLSRLRGQLSYSNVVATTALFVALGGSGYAAAEHLAARSAQVPVGGAGGTAFGRVSSGGVLSRSSNVVPPVGHPKTGIYCIRLDSDIDPAETGILATPDYSSDSTVLSGAPGTGNHAIVEWRGNAIDCPANQLEVVTGRQNSNGTIDRQNQGFFFSSGPSSQPRATAVVTIDEKLDFPHTRGFTSLRKGGTGIYCLSHALGIDPRRDPAVVTAAFNAYTAFAGAMFLAMWVTPSIGCTQDEYEVRTLDFKNGFAQLEDKVMFTIIVP